MFHYNLWADIWGFTKLPLYEKQRQRQANRKISRRNRERRGILRLQCRILYAKSPQLIIKVAKDIITPVRTPFLRSLLENMFHQKRKTNYTVIGTRANQQRIQIKSVEGTPWDEVEGRVQDVSCLNSNQSIPQQVRKISERDPEKDKIERLFGMFDSTERILRKLRNSIVINLWWKQNLSKIKIWEKHK